MQDSYSIVERVRAAADIVGVIGKHIQLKRKGRNFLGLCPFHADKNPSLHVSPDKQIYKCFSCGAVGDIFKFLMEYQRKTFPEVLKDLAHAYHIALPTSKHHYYANPVDAHLQCKDVNKFAARIYHHYLFRHVSAQAARNYLKKRRVSSTMLKRFQIGYAPNQWRFLADRFTQENRFSSDVLLKTGVCQQNKTSSLYDFFRDRIIFPIWNERNEVVGFGGRSLSEDNPPKYLNSQERPFFQKRELLYGLSLAASEMLRHKHVFIVEGYLDVIACQIHDMPAVAPLGTSLTSLHVKKLKRYVDKVTLLFDGDTAGRQATQRACIECLRHRLPVKVVHSASSMDPFDFLTQKGKHAFKKTLSVNTLKTEEFLCLHTLGDKTLSSLAAAEKIQLAKDFKDRLSSIHDKELLTMMYRHAADFFQVDISVFDEDASKSLDHQRRLKKILSVRDKKERQLIVFLCGHPEFVSKARAIITPESLQDKLARYLYATLLHLSHQKKPLTWSGFLDSIERPAIKEYLMSVIVKKDAHLADVEPSVDHHELLFQDYLCALKEHQLTIAIQEAKQSIKITSSDSDAAVEEYARLVLERDNLREYIKTHF